jgi:hypothetical protein
MADDRVVSTREKGRRFFRVRRKREMADDIDAPMARMKLAVLERVIDGVSADTRGQELLARDRPLPCTRQPRSHDSDPVPRRVNVTFLP